MEHQSQVTAAAPAPQIPYVLPHVFPRRCRDFKKLVENTTIEDYLGIIPRKNEKISFDMEMFPEEKYCIFSVKFVTQNSPNLKLDFGSLPQELSSIINSYTSNFISLKFKIEYHYNYPFVEPKWSLISEENDMTHLPKNFALNEYYQEIVERHNGQYSEIARGYNWTPSITIRTDMINFIVKILHFDIITDYCE